MCVCVIQFVEVNITAEISPSSLHSHFTRSLATLVCVASFSPAVTQELDVHIVWSKDGTPVPPARGSYSHATRTQPRGNAPLGAQSQFESRLTIFVLEMDDAGVYSCSVSVVLNSTGQPLALPLDAFFDLRVIGKWNIIIIISDV